MMGTGTRHKILGTFGVVTAGMMMASPASATIYKGKLTASGNGVNNVAQTVVGTGSGQNWCSLPTPTVKVAAGASQISLVTGASVRTKRCLASQMRAGAYQVGVTLPGIGYMPQGGGAGAVHNCYASTSTLVDTGTVDAAGVYASGASGGPNINYTSSAAVGPHSICIYSLSVPDSIAINIDSV